MEVGPGSGSELLLLWGIVALFWLELLLLKLPEDPFQLVIGSDLIASLSLLQKEAATGIFGVLSPSERQLVQWLQFGNLPLLDETLCLLHEELLCLVQGAVFPFNHRHLYFVEVLFPTLE